MKKGDIYYVDLSPVVGNEIGGLRMCQIIEVYAEENLVRVRPMVRHPKTNSGVFREMHDRTVSTKRIKEFVKNKGHIYCPANGYDCPYWKDGICSLYSEEENWADPWEECSDFGVFWDKDDDYIDYD